MKLYTGCGRIQIRRYRKFFFVCVNGPFPSKHFAMAESTLQSIPITDILGSWQLSMGTLSEKLNQLVLKEAQFGYRRWSYVQRAFANFRPMSCYWNSQSQQNFKRTPSSGMTEYESEVDYWKSVVISEQKFGLFSV